MLRILFGLLLLINGGLFAFQQGYLDAWFPDSREPSRLSQQLHADQLRLIPLAEGQPASAPAATLAPVAPAPVHADKTADAIACAEVGNFDADEAKRFETELATLSLGSRLTRSQIQEETRYMVYIPPLAGKDAADKKAGELKHLGISDFFVIQDRSRLQWGISLGIFKSEEAARNHLAALNQKGVHSARVGPHNVGTDKFVFQLRGLDAPTRTRLDKIKTDFPHQDVRACAPPAAV